MTFTREAPSPRYKELLALYREMHASGDAANDIPAEQMFNGKSLVQHAPAIRNILDRYRVDENRAIGSILDYGCGKAEGYEKVTTQRPDGTPVQGLKDFWEIGEAAFYDPAWPPFATMPDGRFDGVISTDVLEHCPEEDLDWILAEIFAKSRVFVYCSVALYAAKRTLPTGENAHITQKPAGWWLDKFETVKKAAVARDAVAIRYFLALMRTPGDIIFAEG